MTLLTKALQDWISVFMAAIPAYDLAVFEVSATGERWRQSHLERNS